MKIEKIDIYSFGKHENISVQFGPHMNVVYGLNEAGKTTIQQFILHVLFGFPPRNSSLLRYEPKDGGKYGGQVHLRDRQYGKCTIERVRGKSAGEVTVYFEDGTKGGEEALQLLLRHYDRAAFEAVFSFSLLQLQGFEKMDEEELSRTLVASGTTGVDSLLEIEKQMEKEMGELFKRSGRNPAMNVKLKELRELEKELKQEQEKLSTYAPSLNRIKEIDTLLLTLRERSVEGQEQLQTYSLLRQTYPLYEQKKALETRLDQLGLVKFPIDGVRRLESLTSKLTEAKAIQTRIASELAEVKKELVQNDKSEQLMEIERFIAKESEWHRWHAALATAVDDLDRLESVKRRFIDRLGVTEEKVEAVLFKADVSIRKEEEMHELLTTMEQLSQDIRFAKSQKELTKNKLEESREALKTLTAPTPEEVEKVNEWPAVKQKLAEAKATVAMEKKQSNQALPIGMFILSVVFIAFGFYEQQWLLVFAGIVFGVGGFWMYPKKDAKHEATIRKMQQWIAAYEHQQADMERLMNVVETYQREQARLESAIHEHEHQYELAVEALRELLFKEQTVEQSLDAFMQQYGFDGLPSPGIVPELFRMIRDLQETIREQESAILQKEIADANIVRRSSEIQQLLGAHASPEVLYELLRKEYHQLKDEANRVEDSQRRREQLEQSNDEKKALVDAYAQQIDGLLEETTAKDMESFYKVYDMYEETIRIKEQVAQIEQQLAVHQMDNDLHRMTKEELGQIVQETDAKMAAIDSEIDVLIQEKAALENKVEVLVTDEAHGNTLQLLAMKKAELAELAKRWSARKAIAEAIRQTMFDLKEKTLPKVLKRAEQIFHQLTEGKYEALMLSEKGMFLAVTANGQRFPIVELSQATKEQAYISLRFALAESVFETAPFPIIIDDPFVHFDERRLSRMIKLLGTLTKHQFIYFTCNSTMKEQWTDATVINVSEIGNEQGAFM